MKDIITYEDFERLDIRIGKVLAAAAPDWSHKLLEMRVDLGAELGERTIFSGIRDFYQPEDLIGKHFAFIVNLAPRKMGPSVSEGMMLMADTTDKPVLMPVDSSVVPGTVVR